MILLSDRFAKAISGVVAPTDGEIERVGVAFGHGSHAVLAATGVAVEAELNDGDLNACLGDGFTDKDPKVGIWVWEGTPIAITSNGFESGMEFEGWDFGRGTWRPATAEEVEDLAAGVSPWTVYEEATSDRTDPPLEAPSAR